ncbi:MAG: glycosyltransferase family 2 protein, partial [Candidatus Anstonellaceae archaeon]
MEWKEGISIIIPVHNQARFLQNTVEQVELQMKNGKMKRFGLVIAEDGSFDGSGAIAKKIAEKNPFVRVLSHKRKMGKGWAIKNALKFCKYEKIIFTDADLSGGTEVFLDMAKALETADLAIGNRYGKYRPKRAIARQILGLGYKLLVDILFLKQSY